MHRAPHIGHLMREAIRRPSQVIKRPSEVITVLPTSGTSSVMKGAVGSCGALWGAAGRCGEHLECHERKALLGTVHLAQRHDDIQLHVGHLFE